MTGYQSYTLRSTYGTLLCSDRIAINCYLLLCCLDAFLGCIIGICLQIFPKISNYSRLGNKKWLFTLVQQYTVNNNNKALWNELIVIEVIFCTFSIHIMLYSWLLGEKRLNTPRTFQANQFWQKAKRIASKNKQRWCKLTNVDSVHVCLKFGCLARNKTG